MIDVGPFVVEAITKMRAPYLEEGLDIFHGCGKCNTNRDSNGNLKEFKLFRQKYSRVAKIYPRKNRKIRGGRIYSLPNL